MVLGSGLGSGLVLGLGLIRVERWGSGLGLGLRVGVRVGAGACITMSPLHMPDAAAAPSGCRMSGGMRSAPNWMPVVAPAGIGPTVIM